MRIVRAQDRVSIPLGRQGENNVQAVVFNVSGWADLYGAGAFEVFHKRNKDTVAYPVVIQVSDDHNTISWIVGNADVEKVGEGECQLVYVVNGKIAKSVIFQTTVTKSLDGSGDPPEPYENRIQDLIESATNITVEADRAETAREGAEDAEGQAEAWATGEIDGVPVPSTAPQNDNNSKYHSQQSEAWATGEIGGVHVPPTAPQNLRNSKQYSLNAQLSANAANTAKNDARVYSQDSRAWAIGVRNGQPVQQGDDTYQNNAKYYSESAEQSAERAAQSADEAGYISFYIDENGDLIYVKTPYVELDFKLQDGDLYVGV